MTTEPNTTRPASHLFYQSRMRRPLADRAEGIYIWDEHGRKVIDGSSGAMVVNIGDNYPFHAGVFAILDAAPCLGIFHDFYIYNLFSGWLHYNGLDYRRHDAEIVATYGEEAVAKFAERLPERVKAGEYSLTTKN